MGQRREGERRDEREIDRLRHLHLLERQLARDVMQDLVRPQKRKVRRIRFLGVLLAADMGRDPPRRRGEGVIPGSGDPLDDPSGLDGMDLRAELFRGVGFDVGVDLAETAVGQGRHGAESAGAGLAPGVTGVALSGSKTPSQQGRGP